MNDGLKNQAFISMLIAVVSLCASGDLSTHHEPFEKSMKKTIKYVSNNDGRFERMLNQARTSKRLCEKYYKRGWKYLMESPDALWMKPSKRGNYPNSSSVMVVGDWARLMGLISLEGCPDGSTFTHDFPRAKQFFEMGAFQYDEVCMYYLGQIYLDGQGLTRDENAGLAWISMAAAEWSESARSFLASNGYAVPQQVQYQTKVLIANETHGDNPGNPSNSKFWNWVGVLSVVALDAYAAYKLAPQTVDATSYAVQKITLPAIMGVSSTVAKTTICPDGEYHRQGKCQLCPDGSYTTAPACQVVPTGQFIGNYGQGFRINPDGSYIPEIGSSVYCPDGMTHAGNWCHLNPDGTFIGITR